VAWTSRVADYLDEVRHLGREQFLVSYPNPILVHHFGRAAARLERFARTAKFRTDLPEGTPGDEVLVGDASDLEAAVHPLRKRAGNAYPDTITVGRADNNDVVVAYDDLSKLHAYFTRSAAGELLLADAGSTNGTWLAGARLAPNESVVLVGRARLGLGEHAFELFLPAALADWLTTLARSAA
jgi:hypothetical protein